MLPRLGVRATLPDATSWWPRPRRLADWSPLALKILWQSSIGGLGSHVIRISVVVDGVELARLLQQVLELYPEASQEPLAAHPVARLVTHDLAELLREAVPDKVVKGGVGVGRFAEVPWVAVMDPRMTASVRTGFFACYFFRSDGRSVYLSLIQGVTEAIERYGKRNYLAALERRSRAVAERLGRVDGFVSGRIDLAARGPIPRGYESGSVYAAEYLRGSLPKPSVLQHDFVQVLRTYQSIAELPVIPDF
jgi:5-methylcytosine-specific restriction protein A